MVNGWPQLESVVLHDDPEDDRFCATIVASDSDCFVRIEAANKAALERLQEIVTAAGGEYAVNTDTGDNPEGVFANLCLVCECTTIDETVKLITEVFSGEFRDLRPTYWYVFAHDPQPIRVGVSVSPAHHAISIHLPTDAPNDPATWRRLAERIQHETTEWIHIGLGENLVQVTLDPHAWRNLEGIMVHLVRLYCTL